MEVRNLGFQKLTPISDADLSVYEEAIDYVFDNNDIRNIALSGAYSSGKSSILESYKKKHANRRFVHISLTHFQSPEQDDGQVDEPVKESVLERKILNQLIHQIPAAKIPQTNFRVKKDVHEKDIWTFTIFTVLSIWSVLFLLSSSTIVSFVVGITDDRIKSILSKFFIPGTTFFAYVIIASFIFMVVFSIIKAQKNRNIFRKISLQGTEIEIFEEQDDSYFDKYLNEVLYLFENVEADVIVFEDMDRFNSSRIFERLREVNALVNFQSEKGNVNKVEPLRFFYLLRDDIFLSKERTKFFDFIIPIVPIVDSSNSYEQFLIHIKAGGFLDRFDQSFLQRLSLYVDDMRILKNIYNEFVVYIHRLDITDLDWNKMLAMITYKNLFPRDFSDLQLDRGFVYSLFSKKSELIIETSELENDHKNELLERIGLAKSETLESLQELDDVYGAKLQRMRSTSGYGLDQNKRTELEDEKTKRKQAIQDYSDGIISELENELSTIKYKLSKIATKSLKDLLTRENIDKYFTINHSNEVGETNKFTELKKNEYFPLLKFLIRSGFIDETYKDYMSYFYEESISSNDRSFLRRITDKRGADYTFTIREPLKVLASPILRNVDFEQEEILNYDLLECLLINNEEANYEEYLKTLIEQLRGSRNFDFVSKFLDTGKGYQNFVSSLNDYWPDFFFSSLTRKELTVTQLTRYSLETLNLSDKDVLEAVNRENCLTNFISQSPNYLEINQPDTDKLISSFIELGIVFNTLDYDVSNKDLFDKVYENNLYALNFENIALMYRTKYGIKSERDILHKNYSLVQSQPDAPLAAYVANNLSDYLDIILDHCDKLISDEETFALEIINNDYLMLDTKKRYIEYLTTEIKVISEVTDKELWTELLDQDIAQFSVENFVAYFKTHGMDEALVGYLNNEIPNHDFSKVADDFDNDLAVNLFNAVAMTNTIENEKYKNILVDLNYLFENYEFTDISDKKIEILISENIIEMSLESLEYVRKNYSTHLDSFIFTNLEVYIELSQKGAHRIEETLRVLSWKIDEQVKIKLLNLTTEKISLMTNDYSDEVTAYIIANNLKPEETPYLYEKYSTFGDYAKTAIVELAAERKGEIISLRLQMDNALLSKLLNSGSITHDDKVNIFISAIPRLTKDTCQTFLKGLGFGELSKFFDKRRGRKNYTKVSNLSRILDEFKLKGWIYDYHDDKRNKDKFEVLKNKPRIQ
ncbi:MAG: hypothetical protein ACOX7C_08210 [Brevefilum sp.]|jgi:hypothetical protein